MPDDDKFTRDHGPGWTGATKALVRSPQDDELPFDDSAGAPSRPEALSAERTGAQRDRAVAKALEHTLGHLGRPDLRAAANDLQEIAQGLHDGSLDPDELCTGATKSGTEALVHQAVRVLAATRRAEDLLVAHPDELATDLAAEFIRGVGRRYGIDRIAPFDFSGTALDSLDALDVLSGFDMFMVGPLIKGIIGELLD